MAEPRTVLCVDDNQELCENLREILEDAGYRVRVAATCSEALDAVQDGIDVGLVDLRLPDGDGVALTRRLRELAPDAQMILLTGFATIESAAAAVRAGAWAYLVKPCSTPRLLLSVEQAVRQIEHLEERRELVRRARLAAKLAAIGTLTAGLSHEVKKPLNAAALQLMVLDRRIGRLAPESQAHLREPLQLVQDEIARLNRIVEEFLEFARPREPRKLPTDLPALLERVTALLAPLAAQARVRIDGRWPASLELAGDEGHLRRAVVNLALNAIQAATAGGVVRIEARAEADDVLVAVEDSGAGIPDELAHRIFEPFFTTKESGSGLGLPIVHGIVEQHGGSLSLERGDLGGARFVIRIPGS